MHPFMLGVGLVRIVRSLWTESCNRNMTGTPGKTTYDNDGRFGQLNTYLVVAWLEERARISAKDTRRLGLN